MDKIELKSMRLVEERKAEATNEDGTKEQWAYKFVQDTGENNVDETNRATIIIKRSVEFDWGINDRVDFVLTQPQKKLEGT